MFLFRWRGYLPLIFLSAVFVSLYLNRVPFEPTDTVWPVVCLAVGLIGIAIRVATVGFVPYMTSGRGTDAPYADSLNTTGMYSITRNPVYIGNFFMSLSPVLLTKNIWLLGLYVAVFFPYYKWIVFAEECFLQRKFGKVYSDWKKQTPRFFPNPSLWKKPDRPFSWQTALRRECISLFTLIVTLWSLQLFEGYVEHYKIIFDQFWLAMLALSGSIYLLIALSVKFREFFDW